MLAKLVSLMDAALRRRRLEQRMDEEMQSHLEMRVQDLIGQGIPPEEARRRARVEFGGVEITKDECRQARAVRWLDDLTGDLHYGLRQLRKHRKQAAVSITTLAIGLGATVAVYGLVSALLHTPTGAVTDPDRLALVWMEDGNSEVGLGLFNNPQYFELQAAADGVFEDLAAFRRRSQVLTAEDYAEQVNLEIVSGNYFETLGVRPALGRTLSPSDDQDGAPPVAMVSHRYWQTHMGGDPAVIGRRLRMNDETDLEVVGVAPASFHGFLEDTYSPPQVWVSMRVVNPTAELLQNRSLIGSHFIVGRLQPDVTLEAAGSALNVIVQGLSVEASDRFQPIGALVIPARNSRIQPGYSSDTIRSLTTTLMAVSVVTLLAACFSTAGFLLGQGFARRQEMALRYALGASRVRVFRQLITESFLLGAAASGLGLVIAAGLARLARTLPPGEFAGQGPLVPLDAGPLLRSDVVLFSVLLTVGVTLLFGLAPALLASARNPLAHIKSRIRWRFGRLPAREIMLGAQVAVSAVVLITAALYARNLAQIAAVEPGYPTDSTLIAQVVTTALTPEERSIFYRELLPRLNSTSGISVAAIGWNPPFSPGYTWFGLPDDPQEKIQAGSTTASTRFFETHGIPIIAGREFMETETGLHDGVIINHILAERFWPGESPLGRTILQGQQDEIPLTVVGVVRTDRCRAVASTPHPCTWRPFPFDGSGYLRVRAEGDPLRLTGTIRDLVMELHPAAALGDVARETDRIRIQTALHRSAGLFTAGLALISMLLMGAACYALVASSLRSRLREMAIRIALGAAPRRIRTSLLLRYSILTAVGLAVGLAAARYVEPAARDQILGATPAWAGLYDVAPSGSGTLLLVSGLMLAITLGATFWSSRGPLRTPPAVVLRQE